MEIVIIRFPEVEYSLRYFSGVTPLVIGVLLVHAVQWYIHCMIGA